MRVFLSGLIIRIKVVNNVIMLFEVEKINKKFCMLVLLWFSMPLTLYICRVYGELTHPKPTPVKSLLVTSVPM